MLSNGHAKLPAGRRQTWTCRISGIARVYLASSDRRLFMTCALDRLMRVNGAGHPFFVFGRGGVAEDALL